MMGFILLVALAVSLVPVAALVLALINRGRLAGLQRQVTDMQLELRGVRTRRQPTQEEAPPVVRASPPRDEVTAQSRTQAVAEAKLPATPASKSQTASVVATTKPAASGEPPDRTALLLKVAVGMGAVAIALAGAFWVKYAIDQGYIGPWTRVGIGLVFGAALVAGAEWLRQRSSVVAQGLAASGIAVLFAALLAGINLYDLISPLVGFLLLALTTATAVVLSRRHGPLVALLGLVGGFLTPLWVSLEEPRPAMLFSYLFLLQVGLLLVTQRRRWWPLSVLTAVGGNLWAASWILDSARPGVEGYPAALFLLATVATFVVAARHARAEDRTASRTALLLVWGSAASALLLLASLVAVASFEPLEWALFALLSLGCLVLGRLDPRYEVLPWLAALSGALLMLIWGAGLDPAESGRYAAMALILALLFIGGSHAALWGARKPQSWAALCSLSAITYLLVAWAGLNESPFDLPWGAVSLGGALLLALLSVPVLERREVLVQGEGVLAALLVGATALVSLAAPLELKRQWISVAWAAEIPALAWLAGRLRVPLLSRLALVLAVGVAVRLLLNPLVLDYPIGETLVFNWLLYGYGLPVLAFAWGARLLRRNGEPLSGEALEGGAMALGFALLGLQVRHGFHPRDLVQSSLPLNELGTYTIVWLAYGTALWLGFRRFGLRPLRLGAIAVSGVALAQALLTQVLVSNPLWVPHSVGGGFLINSLLWIYGLPALIVAALARALHRDGQHGLAHAATVGSAVLAFTLVTLEVRQAFHGSDLSSGATAAAELYAYSLAWILFAAALLVAGLALRSRVLGSASAVFMGIAVVKVFVLDTASLGGLYRVLSLLGLGVSLLALAYIYQRYVFRLIAAGKEEAGS